MMLNVAAAFGSTTAAMLGPGLALRGQDGAMDQAVEGLALEYRSCFLLFMGGVFAYYICFCVYLLVDYDKSYGWSDFLLHLILLFFLFYFIRLTLGTMKRIYKKFRLPPECVVAGSFDPDGTARGRSPEAVELDRLCESKRWQEWPRRQYLYATVFFDEFLGISSKVFAERYKRTAVQTQGHVHRPNNQMLHSIIRYLERPDSPGRGSTLSRAVGRRRGSIARAGSDSPLHCTSDVVSSTAGGGGGGGGGGRRGGGAWWWRGSGDDAKVGLAGAAATELELSAMSSLSPSEYLNSGAISPAESGDGDRA